MPETADTPHLDPLPAAVGTVAGAPSDQAQEAPEPAVLTSSGADGPPAALAASNGARRASATATIPRADLADLTVAAPAAPLPASGPAPAPDAEPAPTEQPVPVPGGPAMAGPAVNEDEAAGADDGTGGGG